jgi:hypothetical protein
MEKKENPISTSPGRSHHLHRLNFSHIQIIVSKCLSPSRLFLSYPSHADSSLLFRGAPAESLPMPAASTPCSLPWRLIFSLWRTRPATRLHYRCCFSLPFPQVWSSAPMLLCQCSTPCLRSPGSDTLLCVTPSTRLMECRSELYPICKACTQSSKSPQPCWSATTHRRSAIPSLVVDLGEPLVVPHPSIR